MRELCVMLLFMGCVASMAKGSNPTNALYLQIVKDLDQQIKAFKIRNFEDNEITTGIKRDEIDEEIEGGQNNSEEKARKALEETLELSNKVSTNNVVEPIGYEATGYNFDDLSNQVSNFKKDNADEDADETFNGENSFITKDVNESNDVYENSIRKERIYRDNIVSDKKSKNHNNTKNISIKTNSFKQNTSSANTYMFRTPLHGLPHAGISLATGLEETDDEVSPNEDENIMDENRPTSEKALVFPSKEEVLKIFKRWISETSQIKSIESRIREMRSKFFAWAKRSAGRKELKDKTSLEKIFQSLLEKAGREKEDKKTCNEECFNRLVVHSVAHLYAILAKQWRMFRHGIEVLQQAASNITKTTLNETSQWLSNVIGLNDTLLDEIDLMSLNQGYHVHYPPNQMIHYDVHVPSPFNRRVTHHVRHLGDKVEHHFDHYYDNSTVDYSVNHYISKVDPCLNGGVIVPMEGSDVQCICKEGYIGTRCEDFDYCSLKPCKNHGKCNPIDIVPRIHCTCSREWYGKLCEKRNPCFPYPCLNDGRCSHDNNGTFECVCKKGYRGNRCQFVDSCYPSPCINDGKCHSLPDDGSFYCECPSTHKGSICQYQTACPQRPCHNGGLCRESSAGDDFQCICKDGFIGKTCDERPCLPNPCLNGATCLEQNNTYTCLCNAWTSGVNCSNVNPCKLKPCGVNGQCIDSASGYKWTFKPMQYYCLCKPPWMGPYCTDNSCKHCSLYAHCDNDSKCVCDEGYSGDGFICEEDEKNPCNPNPCLNGGKCFAQENGNYECQCVLPYQPPLCADQDSCKTDPCHNGRCIPKSDGSYQCICFEGFKGAQCNISDPCHPNPCQNHGLCNVGKDSKASCTCPGQWLPPVCKECACPKSADPSKTPDSYCSEYGQCQCYNMNNATWEFTGKGCAMQSAYTTTPPPRICEPNPCKNSGTCVADLPNKSFHCICSKWFIGKECQILRACIPRNPCWNGGTCKENGQGGFICVCPAGTTGPQCAPLPTLEPARQKHCTSNPCKNDGICKEAKEGFDCECKVRFTGPTCEVDRCQDCDVEAQCIMGHCYCNEGFIGNGYECEPDGDPHSTTPKPPTQTRKKTFSTTNFVRTTLTTRTPATTTPRSHTTNPFMTTRTTTVHTTTTTTLVPPVKTTTVPPTSPITEITSAGPPGNIEENDGESGSPGMKKGIDIFLEDGNPPGVKSSNHKKRHKTLKEYIKEMSKVKDSNASRKHHVIINLNYHKT